MICMVGRMVSSSWTINYAKMKSHALTENYLNLNLTLPIVQLIAQLRTNLFRLIVRNQKIPLQNKAMCPWCNEDSGNSDHYLFDCHYLSPARMLYLDKFLQGEANNFNNFIDVYNLYKASPNFLKNVFYFFVDSLKTLDSTQCQESPMTAIGRSK
jgi:hypothetical protein